MKAAVLNQLGTAPVYKDFKEPAVTSDDELLINMKVAAVKNIDKVMAGGEHYASYKKVPVVVGLDGVGTLEDGTNVYAQGKTGMLAEKAIISKDQYIVLPDNIELPLAAAIPNAAIGSVPPLKARAKMKSGDVVLINGGTGVTGKVALQMAKYYGASKVIVTGWVDDISEELKSLGADQLISTKQDDQTVIDQIKAVHEESPIDIVIDYLWGHTSELIINHISGEGLNNYAQHQTKFVTVGSMASETITLKSGVLRSADTVILGSGFGSLSKEDFRELNQEIIPEMFQLANDGKLHIDIQGEELADIEIVWNKDAAGKRIVINI